MADIVLGFEGYTPDLNDLAFSLFEAGMLREGLTTDAPGGCVITLKPMEMGKGVGHGLIEIGLSVGDKVALPLFLAWLYDKWKKAGEKPISIKIENHFYQFDIPLLAKTIEEAVSRDIWVFGYGSLMWDGWEQQFGGQRTDHAVLVGYRRSFNKQSVKNWGTPTAPGPTLGLEPDQHARCAGTAFQFPEQQHAAVQEFLRNREGASFSLESLLVQLPDGRAVSALTPVNDRSKSTYIEHVPLTQRGDMARSAIGTSGACTDYIRNIHDRLRSLGIVDVNVDEFARLLERPDEGASNL